MRKFHTVFGPALMLFLVFAEARAQYRSDSWTTENGLPQNTVTSIVQSRDGYIWFGTLGGLVRFDGLKFTIFNTINAPAFKTNRITGLHEGKDGTLWIGGQNGSLVSYKNDTFTLVIEKPVAQRTPLGLICADRSGSVWLAVAGGVERYVADESGRFVGEKVELPDDPNPSVLGMAEDNEGAVWISTSKALNRFFNGAFESFRMPETAGGQPSAFTLFLDRSDRIWLVSKSAILRFEEKRFVTVLEKNGANFALTQDPSGRMFLFSDGKVSPLNEDGPGKPVIDDPAKTEGFRVLLADREGNIWIGATGRGLARFKQQTARTYSKSDGLTDRDTRFAFEDREKNIWIGSADGLFRFREGKFELVRAGISLASAYQTRDGKLWFGGDERLLIFASDTFSDFSLASGIKSDKVFEDRAGTLWFPEKEKLVAVRDGVRREFTSSDGYLNSGVQSITEDPEGAIWFAMAGGASRFKDGEFVNYTHQNGLSNENVRDIHIDGDGVVWLGTYGGGLLRFKNGKFSPITTREGMNEDIVSRIIADDRDNFWLLGNRGVSVISRTALNDLADGKIKTIVSASYGVSDGMTNSEGNGGNFPAGWLASDGRFWFPSIQGVIAIDPKFSGPPPPPVFIESVFLAGREVAGKQEIDVGPETGNLEINYTGLHFTKPEQVKFKYKLEGFDEDWIEVGGRRTAYYSQIPPGKYLFLVTASTTNGVWNETPASRIVIVRSDPVWKKWWFILAASVFVVLVIVVVFRLRLRRSERSRQHQQAFARQLIESQENERKRIAGELHDGLGQTLLIIKNRAFLGIKANNLESAAEQLNEISVSSGAAINQAREIAYFLRPTQLERLGLTSAIESMVAEAGDASGIRFECEIDPLDDFFASADEINFFRIVQESVNNILKHSEATGAGVFVSRIEDRIELLVEDNGKGFVAERPGVPSKSGFGLIGMEERVRILGGKMNITADAGKGVKITVEISKSN